MRGSRRGFGYGHRRAARTLSVITGDRPSEQQGRKPSASHETGVSPLRAALRPSGSVNHRIMQAPFGKLRSMRPEATPLRVRSERTATLRWDAARPEERRRRGRQVRLSFPAGHTGPPLGREWLGCSFAPSCRADLRSPMSSPTVSGGAPAYSPAPGRTSLRRAAARSRAGRRLRPPGSERAANRGCGPAPATPRHGGPAKRPTG